MQHDPSLGDSAELAALYASGTLEPAERDRFEAHVDAGCDACSREVRECMAVISQMMLATPAVTPESSTREALLQRVSADVCLVPKPSPLHPHLAVPESKTAALRPVTKRASEGGWTATEVDGVEIRVLHVDREQDSFAALVRMRAGAAYPAHTHRGPEHCLVMEGTLRVGGEVLHSGDYHMAPMGSEHGIQQTDDGCVLFITSSLSDEFA